MKHSYFTSHISKGISLVGFGFLIILLSITPAMAEMHISSPVSLGIPDQFVVEKTPAYGTFSGSSLKSSFSPPYVNRTYYVGQYFWLYGWQQSGGPPIPNVTISFQRSDDGISYCTIQTSVSNASGYVQLQNYTESCPGIVYYRIIDEYGIDSDPYIVEWVQTDPPASCVPPPVCAFTYSITCIENYDHICGGPGETNCSINGTISECDKFDTRLSRTPGWTRNFYNKDGDVIIQNFGTLDVYPQSLTESTFHIHSGHGLDVGHLSGTILDPFATGIIPLKSWNYDASNPPFFYNNGINALDVSQKWGNKNKWVMIDSCHVLSDEMWGQALTTSHGILGFSGVSYVNDKFPDLFLDNAINQNMTMVDAFQLTTTTLFDNTSAVAIVKSKPIYKEDHFPGTGYMAPDENGFNDPIYIEWPCNVRSNQL